MITSQTAARASAIVFAVLYAAALHVPELPEGAYSDTHVIDLVTEPSSRLAILLGGASLTVAGLALLPFVAYLTTIVRQAVPDGILPLTTFAGGLLYAGMVIVAAQYFSGYAGGIAMGEVPAPADATLVRVLNDHGFGTLLVGGLLSAGVMVLSACLAGSAVLPTWVRRTGFPVAASCLLGAAWMPQYLVVLWILTAAFTLRSPVPASRDLAPTLT